MHLTQFEQWLFLGLISGLFMLAGFLLNKYVLPGQSKDKDKEDPLQVLINQLMEKVDLLRTDMAEMKAEMKADNRIQILRNEQIHEQFMKVDERFDKTDKRIDNHAERILSLEKGHAKNHS